MEYLTATTNDILTSLRETISYCRKWITVAPREPSREFRRPQLLEAAAAVFPDHFSWLYGLASEESDDGYCRPQHFPAFLTRRASLIEGGLVPLDVVDRELRRHASLLVIDKFAVSNDQMAEGETDCYVDAGDLTPWDTWIHLEDGQLLSWVPDWMQGRMNEAIQRESHSAYSWTCPEPDQRLRIVGWGSGWPD